MRSSVLVVLALLLGFGLIEPGMTHSLKLANAEQKFDADFKLNPLKSAELQKPAVLTEAVGGSLSQPTIKNPKGYKHEDTSKRNAFTSTYVNNDGTRTMEYSANQRNYKDGADWKKIDNSLNAVLEKAPAPTLWQTITGAQPEASAPKQFKGKAGIMSADMKPLSEGVVVNAAGKTITMKPVGARNAKPIKHSDNSVIYKDAWPHVDIEYELRGESIKEIIILKNKSAQTNFDFTVTGGKVINHPSRQGELTIEGLPEEYSFSALTLSLQDRGVISETRVTQAPNKHASGISVTMDDKWVKEQPASSFPMRIDPSLSRAATSYWMYKSDGYSCGSSNCYANIGAIYDNGWKNWRTYFQFPYNDLAGKTIVNATLHGYFKYGVNADQNGRGIAMGHASCIGYWCQGNQVGWTSAATDFDIDFTGGLQQAVNNNDWGRAWSLWGEEGAYKTIKSYQDIVAYVTYDTPTPIATPATPADQQTIIDTQPTLAVNPVSDGDGDAVKYYFRVSTSQDAETGAVINSGWVDTPQWTIPDGILQDGTTYYWHTYTHGARQTNPNWIRNFKVNMRLGKDSTQSFDTVGPVGIDLATGNATLGKNTHSIDTLGGGMGLNLTYNTPNRAKKGLKGDYWNVPSGYNFASGAPTSSPTASVRDSKIDFQWGSGAPSNASGIGSDWFYSRWTGQFVAPATGAYQFGGNNDDNMRIWINNLNQDLYNNAYTAGGVQYGSTINLEAGQIVPIRVDYMEVGGGATAQLYVKGAVAEQVVPQEWLYMHIANQSQNYGLTGRYYTNPGFADIDAAMQDPNRLMMIRRDSKMSLNFGSGGPAAGMQVDNFMARWTGYITVPKAGQYKLGADSDDGIRIKVNTGTWQTPLNSWTDQAGRFMGAAVSLPANTPIPIQVDWYERGGGASLNLLIQSDDTGVSLQDIPATWLTPDANVLPEQWKLGVNASGNVNYERLRVSNSSVILEDSTGSTHEYTYTNGGYKPPVNENGTLSKNADNTYTFIDTDGRTYVFDTSGQLSSLTSPVDDRQPAALKYIYAGSPSRLIKIEDGTTNARYANVYYKSINDSDNICDKNGTNNPSNLFGLNASFADAPLGKLCAFKTSDGDITNFYYDSNGNLTRVVEPGGQVTDYAYDAFGRIVSTRDNLAADAIAAGVRSNDASVTTQLSYDSLGRISSVKAPAAKSTGNQLEHTYEYKLSDTVPLNRLHKSSPANHILTSSAYLQGSQYDWMNLTHASRYNTPGTHPIYSCLRSNGTRYATSRVDCHIPQNINLGTIGYLHDSPTGQATTPISRIRASDGYVLEFPAASLAGWVTEEVLGYGYASPVNAGVTKMHITGASEPQGFSKRLEYDSTLRTTKTTDLTGKNTLIEWDAIKDIQHSVTDATGLKSTTIFDSEDRPIDSYGPAPAAWFGSDRKPTANYTSQVPHSSTGYDEGIYGLAISAYPNKKLLGAPKYVTTGFGNLPYASYGLNLNNGIVTPTDGLSIRATGKIRLDQAGRYTFRMWHADGARLYINDQLIANNWADGQERFTSEGVFDNPTAGKTYRITIEAYRSTTTSDPYQRVFAMLAKKAPGATAFDDNVGAMLAPAYNLTTSATSHDAQLGNIASTTQYKDPAYGQVASTTLNPGGLNYTSQASYEAPGSGYLRQLSSTLPGGATSTYQYYSGTETRDNPCTTEVEAFHQAGRLKSGADPTGRTSETVYNNSGDTVATRYNNDAWTCLTYDSRGRVISTIVPHVNNGNGRTITNNYAVGGNPLITSISDSSGTVTTETDLLGRVVKYTDARGNVTDNTYDELGKLTKRVSLVGTETYEYDSYDRLTKQKLDSVTLASITYDEFSRIDTVEYPAGMSLRPATRDSLERVKKVTYRVNDQDISDEITRSTSGLVLSSIENGVGKSYAYDKAGRLTGATVGNNTFAYGYGTPDSSCNALAGNNPNAQKDGNRTTYTLNGHTVTSCYNMGDQLIASSDPRFNQATYDAHGNTTSLGDSVHKTEFSYDATDRNMGIKETTVDGQRETLYDRDVNNRIFHRTYKINNATVDNSFYGFTGGSDESSFVTDANGNVIQKYLNLVGGVKVTVKPQSTSAGATTYSISNQQGNVMATVNADGIPTVIAPNGPFGEKLANHSVPMNATTGTSNDYMGIHRKFTETDYLIQPIQMGARVYIPELGRFMQIDSVEGGAVNAYTYALDPVNQKDVNGQFIQFAIIAVIVVVSIVIAAKSIKTAVKKPTPTNITIAVIDSAGAAASGFTGGTSIAASKGASAGVRAAASAGISAAEKKATQLAANKAAGKEAERIALERAKAKYGKEYELRTQEYYKVEGFKGGRYADITAFKDGARVFNIEVKSGNAKYGGVQEAKDKAILNSEEGVPTYLWRIPLSGK